MVQVKCRNKAGLCGKPTAARVSGYKKANSTTEQQARTPETRQQQQSQGFRETMYLQMLATGVLKL